MQCPRSMSWRGKSNPATRLRSFPGLVHWEFQNVGKGVLNMSWNGIFHVSYRMVEWIGRWTKDFALPSLWTMKMTTNNEHARESVVQWFLTLSLSLSFPRHPPFFFSWRPASLLSHVPMKIELLFCPLRLYHVSRHHWPRHCWCTAVSLIVL